jgi:NAD-dependent DNA ligase
MRKSRLKLPADQHGQPIRPPLVTVANRVSKAVDQLSGICSGILADNEVNEAEANFFAKWIATYAEYEPVWPFTEIVARLRDLTESGVWDAENLAALRQILEQVHGKPSLSDHETTYATILPLDNPMPEPVVFSGRVFHITGRFASGTRQEVFNAVTERGGVATDDPPRVDSDYLVIGKFASRDWANTNYGRKIERAVELRASGSKISIISEDHFLRFLKERGS